jgi:O-glycosyl hydrolase
MRRIPSVPLGALVALGVVLLAGAAVRPPREAPLRVRVAWDRPAQTLHGFGASDAWSVQHVGLWPGPTRDSIADLLFSRDTDADGKPRGIGLSIWRFNIGAGSAAAGEASGIRRPWRRAEGFLRDDGSYDWSRQAGQQWFLRAARDRGVRTLIAFANSPPVQLTRNGLAYGDGGAGSNLDPARYADYATFLATVARHFEDEGLGFDYISPINEPQWDWSEGNGQEGSPYRNDEIVALTRVLARHFEDADVAARIELPEAARLDFLVAGDTDRPERDDQLETLFGDARLQALPAVAPSVAGHGYGTTWPVERMVEIRRRLRTGLAAVDADLEYSMTEYCILEDNEEIQGPGRDLGIDPALYVARLIHVDLAVAEATSWQWWLAVSPYDYKDGLVYVDRDSRRVHDSKLLWALGNFSRFLQPGAVRLHVSRDDGADPVDQAAGLMVSAYRSADGRTPVVVAVNYGTAARPVLAEVAGVPVADRPRAWQPYVTDASRDLAPGAAVPAGQAAVVPPRSVVTLVGR